MSLSWVQFLWQTRNCRNATGERQKCFFCNIIIFQHAAERFNYISSRLPNCVFIHQKECDWMKQKLSLNFLPKISPLILEKSVNVNKMIRLLTENKLYGFALVDIKSTENANFFKQINWRPIYKKFDVQFEMLPLWMRAKMNPKSFPRTTLVQGMEANEILLHSELLYFYIKKGFYISKLYRFFEYQGSPALSKVYKDVYEARVAATNTSDETKSTAIKDRYLLKKQILYNQINFKK